MTIISIKPEEGKCPYLDDSGGYLPLLFPFQDAYTYRAKPPLIFAFHEEVAKHPGGIFSIKVENTIKKIKIILIEDEVEIRDENKWEISNSFECECDPTTGKKENVCICTYIGDEVCDPGHWSIEYIVDGVETAKTIRTFCLMPFLYPRPGEVIAAKKPLFFVDKNIAKDCSKYKLYDDYNNSYYLMKTDAVAGNEDSVWTSEKVLEEGVYTVHYNNSPLTISSFCGDSYKIEISKCSDIYENHLMHLLRQFFRHWSIWKVAESYTRSLFQDRNYGKNSELPSDSFFEDRQYDNRYESEQEVTWQKVLTAGGRGIFTGDRVVNNQQTDNLPYPEGMIPVCKGGKFYSDPTELAILYMVSKWIGRQSLNSYKAHMLIGHFHRPLLFPIRKEQVKQAFEYVNFNSEEDEFVKSHISILSIIEKCLNSSKESDIKTAFSMLNETRRLPWDWISDFYSFIYDYSKGSEFFSRLKVNPQLLFYGPPGTGKTFSSRIESEWIVDWWWYNKVKKPCGKNSIIKSKWFIELCQFHPSYTYEEFIEGMRPDVRNGKLTYRVQEGPFKRFCRKAGYLERLLYVLAHANDPSQSIVNKFDPENAAFYRKLGYAIWVKENDVWLYTPCNENGIKLGWWDDQKNDWREVENYENGRLDLLKQIFYSEILKEQDKEDHEPSKLAYSSMRAGEKNEKIEFPPFVFIVDEINRANLSAVLGELMFCLEYRGVDGSIPLTYDALSMDNANRDAYAPIKLNSQDTNDRFFVPSNIYFIGTMNTIDKSTESIDFALRRRFGWWYLAGEETINLAVFHDNSPSDFENIENEVHKPLNEKLEKHLSRQSEDLRMGPTYFYKLKEIHKVLKDKNDSLKWLYQHYLRPTLEDYFQGNTSKWKNAENDLINLFDITTTTDLDKRATVNDLANTLNIIPQVIIYGPPGTGKTYLARQYKENFSVPDNQWEFIQFHPAYTYEDFLQGIRPVSNDKEIDYKLTPGKFKSFCMRAGALERALFAGLLSEETEAKFGLYKLVNNKIYYDGIAILEWQETETGHVFFIGNDTQIFHTKTQGRKANIEAIEWILKTISKDIWIDNIIEELNILGLGLKEEQIADKVYLNGLRKKHHQHYTIVIDEINRGDLASIFGELMYCLEYRGPDGHIQLPYTIDKGKSDKGDYFASVQGREVFFIPSNVRIIGTMNTIDRSTEPIDYAMRRRFAWLRVGPDEQTLEKALKELSKERLPKNAWKESHKEIRCIVDMFSKFNEILKNIRSMPSEDFRIGETYFFRIIDLLREAYETCGDSNDKPIESAFQQIKRGPLKFNERVIDLLFEQYLEPVLEDYFTLAGKRWRLDKDGKKEFKNIIDEIECAKKQKSDNRTNGTEEG